MAWRALRQTLHYRHEGRRRQLRFRRCSAGLSGRFGTASLQIKFAVLEKNARLSYRSYTKDETTERTFAPNFIEPSFQYPQVGSSLLEEEGVDDNET